MDLTPTEEQREVRDLARRILSREVDADRLALTGAAGDGFDTGLWSHLAGSGLLGVAVPEEHGGLGLGLTGLALVAMEVGAAVPAVPFAAVAVAARALALHADAGLRAQWLPPLLAGDRLVLVPAAPARARLATDGAGRLSGRLEGVAFGHVADAFLVAAGGSLRLLAGTGPGVRRERGTTTGGHPAARVDLADAEAPALAVGDGASAVDAWLLCALAATQAGVTRSALAAAAAYTSQRHQFGKPLSAFQAVALKAADGFIDHEAIRLTALQAAWRLDTGEDATVQTLTAAWWAAEAGQHCVHLTAHLHGGVGADVTYPGHRYLLWGKQLELELGGASALVARLADALAARPDAGDEVVLRGA